MICFKHQELDSLLEEATALGKEVDHLNTEAEQAIREADKLIAKYGRKHDYQTNTSENNP
jgi:hypothetical protein